MDTQIDLQTLWQQDSHREENSRMWMQLVNQKRASFYERMRLENQAEYLVALMLTPLLAFMAFKAKYPWVQAGFGLLACTLGGLALIVWLTQRDRPVQNDRSLSD